MKRIIPYLISFLFTIGCFLIHMSENSDSMLNNKSHVISNQDLQSVIDFHKSSSTFSKRPFTTFLIEKTSDLFQLKIGESFIIINFFFISVLKNRMISPGIKIKPLSRVIRLKLKVIIYRNHFFSIKRMILERIRQN